MKNITSYQQHMLDTELAKVVGQVLFFRDTLQSLKRAKELLEMGANVETVFPDAFHRVVQHGVLKTFELINAFVKSGMEINKRHPELGTPLEYAVKRDNRPAARVLIENGANVYDAFSNGIELDEFFRGDTDWMPSDVKRWAVKTAKAKRVFGV